MVRGAENGAAGNEVGEGKYCGKDNGAQGILPWRTMLRKTMLQRMMLRSVRRRNNSVEYNAAEYNAAENDAVEGETLPMELISPSSE